MPQRRLASLHQAGRDKETGPAADKQGYSSMQKKDVSLRLPPLAMSAMPNPS